jgi:hypothetical protein
MEPCSIVPDKLRAWAGAARRLYRDNPFHSWFHGVSVFQMCFYQLRISKISAYLRFLDVFALLVAALCHDLDHPGYTNSFLISTEDELALRYNDVSVLENHHASLACDLMRKEDSRINSGLCKSSLPIFRRSIIKCILDTDMAHHSALCQTLQADKLPAALKECQSLERGVKLDEVRQPLLGILIHAADLSAQVLPWHVASQWEERISREFTNQVSDELQRGLMPAPFMQFNFTDLKQRGKLQKDFIDFVLRPLWRPHTDLIPELEDCYGNLISNRACYDFRCNHGKDQDETETKAGPRAEK